MCAGAAGRRGAGGGGGLEPLQDGGGHQGPAAAGGQSELNMESVTKYTVIITDYIFIIVHLRALSGDGGWWLQCLSHVSTGWCSSLRRGAGLQTVDTDYKHQISTV